MTARRLAVAVATAMMLSGCQGGHWQGLNSLPLPGTHGRDDGSIEVQAQLPDVSTVTRNSRVRVGDVTVGNVTRVERQGWHALVTMRLDPDVDLPANATATVGQTSLLGSLHIELAAPTGAAAHGHLHNGSVIPLSSAGAYPSTETTLAALATLLSGGGLGQIQDITAELSTAFADGRDADLRQLLDRIDTFVANLNTQSDDIIEATRNVNDLAAQFAAQQPVVDEALRTIPDAVAVFSDERGRLVDALTRLGRLARLAGDASTRTSPALVAELNAMGPVLRSLADAGPALTRALSILLTFPFPKETLSKWMRGDYGNQTQIIDLTLSRIDAAMLTGTRFEGKLTEAELRWGRTIGQFPSPYTHGNPLTIPYQPQGS